MVTPYGRTGGSSRVRVYDWLDHLGLSAQMHAYRGSSDNRPRTLLRDPLRTARAEVSTRRVATSGSLLVSREASPLSTGRLESRLLRSAGHGVYDVDDALFHDTGSGVRRLFSKADTFARAVAAADVVVAGNDYLADRASRTAREVVVIPSCVEPAAYRTKTDYAVAETPRIVWVGSPSTEAYLLGIAPALSEVHRRTGARVHVISAGSASLGELDPIVERTDWGTTTSDSICAGDVAIGPLTDTPYARGKCAYKLLQYAAAGLPMVASPVGANRAALDVLGGSAATSQSDWVDALTTVLRAPGETRALWGARAREQVAEHYSFDRWADSWMATVQP